MAFHSMSCVERFKVCWSIFEDGRINKQSAKLFMHQACQESYFLNKQIHGQIYSIFVAPTV
ncbi:MAG TPA: hypothetical protein PLP53_09835, partial [Plasticicumulans sp.]|nr:hypothetical protein [Plasticicumulans sp.]